MTPEDEGSAGDPIGFDPVPGSHFPGGPRGGSSSSVRRAARLAQEAADTAAGEAVRGFTSRDIKHDRYVGQVMRRQEAIKANPRVPNFLKQPINKIIPGVTGDAGKKALRTAMILPASAIGGALLVDAITGQHMVSSGIGRIGKQFGHLFNEKANATGWANNPYNPASHRPPSH
jgi:hypothetical protein